jgi:GTPase SAR1 family protein
MRNMSNIDNRLNNVKLVFGGLDNAGKTSFLIALRQKYNYYESVQNLKPTIEIEYSSFNFLDRFNINIWDMGGQEKYRAMYEKNPIYFEATDFLYYIIDIQDKEKFATSLNYLNILLEILNSQGYTNEIMVCFHKFDPRYENNFLFTKARENLKESILDTHKKNQFRFFDTTYYDIASLSQALSYGLNKLINLDLVYNKLENLAEKYNCTYIGIYDHSGIIIADNFKDAMDKREFEENIKIKMKHDLVLIQKLSEKNINFDETMSQLEAHIEYTKQFFITARNIKNAFYLTAMAPELGVEDFKKEIPDIQNILEKSLS